MGEPETAIQHANQGMRLSPNDTHLFNMRAVVSYGHLFAGRFDEAVSWAEMAVGEGYPTAWRALTLLPEVHYSHLVLPLPSVLWMR